MYRRRRRRDYSFQRINVHDDIFIFIYDDNQQRYNDNIIIHNFGFVNFDCDNVVQFCRL